MAKVLKVVDPFLRLDLGDTFELSEDGNYYVSSVVEDFTDTLDNGEKYTTKYHADFTISKEYAAKMIEDGYLEEVKDKKLFVNIFDEINTLIDKYESELKNLGNEDLPACMKVEKETVLNNLVTVLTHLRDLKKN